jgi:hypothetical protein
MPLVCGDFGGVRRCSISNSVELVFARRGALAQTEEAICELLAIIREDGADPDRTGALQVMQEAACIGGGLGLEYADEDPSGRPVDSDQQVAARGFVRHLRQILHVDVHPLGTLLRNALPGSG